MTTIADIISFDVKPEERLRREEKADVLSSPLICQTRAKPSRKYECEVFNYMLDKKHELGINTIYTFKNLGVDGAVLLVDGRRVAVEIKMRMNWKKALESQAEIRRFLMSSHAQTHPVKNAIVFFEQFQGGDWPRKAKSRTLAKRLESLVHQLLQGRGLPC
jgi:hypothetical protein